MRIIVFLFLFISSFSSFCQSNGDVKKSNIKKIEGLWENKSGQKFEISVTDKGLKYRNLLIKDSWAIFTESSASEYVCSEVSGSLFIPNFVGTKITLKGDMLEIQSKVDNQYYFLSRKVTTSESGNLLQADQSKDVREDWARKGGSMRGTSLQIGGSYSSFSKDGFTMTGGGLRGAVQQNYYKLNLPEYSEVKSKWNSFVFGYGASIDATSYTMEFDTPGLKPIETNQYTIAANLNLGYTLGIGRYLYKDTWKGTIIDFYYKPSFMNVIPDKGESMSQFNFMGFGVDFNFATFTSALNKIAPRPGKKVSLLVLPQTDKTPFFFSITIGWTWYD